MPSRKSQASGPGLSTSRSTGDHRLPTASEIRALARKYDVKPSKSLGQNFVIDPNTIRRIVRLAKVSSEDNVIEVGAGFGSLTMELASSARRVRAIEFDRKLVKALSETVGSFENVEIQYGDALKLDYSKLLGGREHRFISNLPFNIGTPLVAKLLEGTPEITDFVVLVQREVGERLVASPGSKTYGGVSVLVRYHCNTDILGKVPGTVFWPSPKVESILVHLVRRPPPFETPSSELMKIVRAAFSQRRKTLVNSLTSGLELEAEHVRGALSSAGLSEQARAEELSVEDFDRLARSMTSGG
jgi:16S rRNA (adenine1518-N6/adenine1519-N6)-dimethyltransferase